MQAGREEAQAAPGWPHRQAMSHSLRRFSDRGDTQLLGTGHGPTGCEPSREARAHMDQAACLKPTRARAGGPLLPTMIALSRIPKKMNGKPDAKATAASCRADGLSSLHRQSRSPWNRVNLPAAAVGKAAGRESLQARGWQPAPARAPPDVRQLAEHALVQNGVVDLLPARRAGGGGTQASRLYIALQRAPCVCCWQARP